MKNQILTGIIFLMLMTILTGVLYPGLITIISNLVFQNHSQGSLVEKNGFVIGSELIGQECTDMMYFWSRPSANNYNPLPSGGSNLGHMNPTLQEQAGSRVKLISVSGEQKPSLIVPSDLVTASASGLDPHISPASALFQVERVAEARNLNQEQRTELISLIDSLKEGRQFLVLGDPRVNVFKLNLMLDNLK